MSDENPTNKASQKQNLTPSPKESLSPQSLPTTTESNIARRNEPPHPSASNTGSDNFPTYLNEPPTPSQFPPPLLQGEIIKQRYEVRQLLGQGSTSHVYLVFDPRRERLIALKRFLFNDESFRQRIRKEIAINESLSHPSIIRTYEIDEDPRRDFLFLTMQYIQGKTLSQIIQQATQRRQIPPLPIRTTLNIIEKLAEVIDYAHSKGVIHRDIKPSNILIDQSYSPHLMDFGTAQQIVDMQKKALDSEGTVYFMAPEQRKGNALTPQTDIYSLGSLTYLMLTGELYQGGAPTPSTFVPDLPDAVEDIIKKATHWDPMKRYPNASLFAQSLKKAISTTQTTYTITQAPSSHAKQQSQTPIQDIPTTSSENSPTIKEKNTPSPRKKGKRHFKQSKQKAEQHALEAQLSSEKFSSFQLEGSGELIFAIQSHEDWVTHCDYSSGGSWVVSTGWDGLVKIRHAQKGTLKKTLRETKTSIESSSFSHDGKLLGIVANNGTVEIWNLKRGLLEHSWQTDDALDGGCFIGEDRRFLTYDQKGNIKLWDTQSGRLLRTFKNDEPLNDLQKVDDEQFITCSATGQVTLWNLSSKKPQHLFPRYKAPLTSCTPAFDKNFILTASADGSLQIWDIQRDQIIDQLQGNAIPIRCTALSYNARLLLAADDEGFIQLWDYPKQLLLLNAQLSPKIVSSCAFDPHHKRFITAHHDGILAFWRYQLPS